MKSVVKREIKRVTRSSQLTVLDDVIVEEPLEILINVSKVPLLVTMRTPGMDKQLTLGLLFSLSVIHHIDEVISFKQLNENKVQVHLRSEVSIEPKRLTTNSSCGMCNGNTWEEVTSHSSFPIFDKSITVREKIVAAAHKSLLGIEDDFNFTGGNHKVNLLNFRGQLLVSAEDVGRHNALDKVIGQCLKEESLPLKSAMLVLSGRCSYEMCQKAWLAGAPIVISRGAPTSKAIELADAAGITLVGFARAKSFNIYTHPYRIINE